MAKSSVPSFLINSQDDSRWADLVLLNRQATRYHGKTRIFDESVNIFKNVQLFSFPMTIHEKLLTILYTVPNT